MLDGRERTFDFVGRAQLLPVLGGRKTEGQQRVAILGQAFHRLVTLCISRLAASSQIVMGDITSTAHSFMRPGRSENRGAMCRSCLQGRTIEFRSSRTHSSREWQSAGPICAPFAVATLC